MSSRLRENQARSPEPESLNVVSFPESEPGKGARMYVVQTELPGGATKHVESKTNLCGSSPLS